MKANEELESMGVERCPECKCATGDDWEYVDFSNKTVIECPQCKHHIYTEAEAEAEAQESGANATKYFQVQITETVEMTAEIEADTLEEAKEKAEIQEFEKILHVNDSDGYEVDMDTLKEVKR